uniref:Metalloendopeptidase n=1 Tax=Romanomermis culicivorax TaxID=13658 RepID=A0A915I5E1_ROMCU
MAVVFPTYHSNENFNKLGIFRSAVANQFRLWIDAVVPYEIDGQFDSKERQIILTTIDRIHETTCVRFLPRTNEVDHVLIFRGKGCYSNVGKQGGCQNVSLDRGCMHHEVIVHELMHALGFWHEHSRHDRDDYVTIKWQNIDEIYHDQFQKVERAKMDDLDELYDYFSIMHYGSKAFSSNGENTIEANNPAFTKFLGKSIDLSEVDISKVRKLYKCHKSTTTGYETLSTTIKPKGTDLFNCEISAPPSPLLGCRPLRHPVTSL